MWTSSVPRSPLTPASPISPGSSYLWALPAPLVSITAVRSAPRPPISPPLTLRSGDSTIAGFAHAIAAGADDETVLRTANTCGKLNAMDPMTGHLVMDRWDEVYNGVVVTEL